VLNGGIMLALGHAGHHDLNVRSAWVHMLGDALGSMAIIAGAFVIRYTGWVRVDPVLSILIGALIVWTAWDIARESLNILLEGLPRGLKLRDVAAAIEAVPGVEDVHDLHIWSLGSSVNALSCHVRIADVPPSVSESVLRSVNEVLEHRFHICHTTIQFEHARCAISENGCAIPVGDVHEHLHHE
jgi:cobalt-zinc-cadmium efflux system protein